MADDLRLLDQWFGRILAGLSPPMRRRAALKLARELRKSNAARIGQNVEPDGSAMTPRIPRPDKRGRMYRGLRQLKSWRITADADGLEIAPANGAIDRVASVSQFGENALVGYLRNGRAIRTTYARRRLLGFSDADRTLALDIAAEMIDTER